MYTGYLANAEFAMSVTKEQVESALKQYIDPYFEKDPVTAGVVKDIVIEGIARKFIPCLFPQKREAENLNKLRAWASCPGRHFFIPPMTT